MSKAYSYEGHHPTTQNPRARESPLVARSFQHPQRTSRDKTQERGPPRSTQGDTSPKTATHTRDADSARHEIKYESNESSRANSEDAVLHWSLHVPLHSSYSLWAGAGAPEGVHAGGRWGPMARRRRRFFWIFLFWPFFTCFHGNSAAMLSRLATACRRS